MNSAAEDTPPVRAIIVGYDFPRRRSTDKMLQSEKAIVIPPAPQLSLVEQLVLGAIAGVVIGLAVRRALQYLEK